MTITKKKSTIKKAASKQAVNKAVAKPKMSKKVERTEAVVAYEATKVIDIPVGGSTGGSSFMDYVRETITKRARTRGKLYSAAEAAERIGVSRNTLKVWRSRAGAPQPTYAARLGDVVVWFYTDQDIKTMSKYVKR